MQLQIHNCIINLLLFIFSSPLGELFDHGLDSSAAFLIPISLFSLFGHGPHSVTLWELYQLMLACLLGFYLAHWEKYNTGTLFLPWTYDASQIVSFFYCAVGFKLESTGCQLWGNYFYATPHLASCWWQKVGGGNALISFFSMKAIMKFIFNRLTVVM